MGAKTAYVSSRCVSVGMSSAGSTASKCSICAVCGGFCQFNLRDVRGRINRRGVRGFRLMLSALCARWMNEAPMKARHG